MWLISLFLSVALVAAQTTDGGRSELPGMRKDMFDQIKDSKNKGGTRCRRFTNSKYTKYTCHRLVENDGEKKLCILVLN